MHKQTHWKSSRYINSNLAPSWTYWSVIEHVWLTHALVWKQCKTSYWASPKTNKQRLHWLAGWENDWLLRRTIDKVTSFYCLFMWWGKGKWRHVITPLLVTTNLLPLVCIVYGQHTVTYILWSWSYLFFTDIILELSVHS